MIETIKKRVKESIDTKNKLFYDNILIEQIEELSLLVLKALQTGNKVFFAGNGGSFSDAFHLAGEFVSRFMFDREALPAIALGGNNSILTAIGNDYSFTEIFSREIKALGKSGDVFIAISTSGNSKNILSAIKTAKEKGVNTWGLTGISGGKMKDVCDCICVPSGETPRIQESHILIGHIICELVEHKYFKSSIN
jgi:D-sedoheptulose 7-phosphate isomerase